MTSKYLHSQIALGENSNRQFKEDVNPILVSYVAKEMLTYHGLRSGIKRALEQWPQIEFIDDHV